jgi:hypothetical protein
MKIREEFLDLKERNYQENKENYIRHFIICIPTNMVTGMKSMG